MFGNYKMSWSARHPLIRSYGRDFDRGAEDGITSNRRDETNAGGNGAEPYSSRPQGNQRRRIGPEWRGIAPRVAANYFGVTHAKTRDRPAEDRARH
jgi:hypothetical protein